MDAAWAAFFTGRPSPGGDELPEWIEGLADDARPAFEAKDRPTRRPGSYLLLTGEQWDLYDQMSALRERQQSRFGDLAGRLGGVSHLGPAFGGTGLTRGRMLL